MRITPPARAISKFVLLRILALQIAFPERIGTGNLSTVNREYMSFVARSFEKRRGAHQYGLAIGDWPSESQTKMPSYHSLSRRLRTRSGYTVVPPGPSSD